MRTQYYLFMLIASTLFFSTFSMEQKEKKTVQFSPECTVKGYEKSQPYEELFHLENIQLSDKESILRNLKRAPRKKQSAHSAEFICAKSSVILGLSFGALYCIMKNSP